MNGSSRLIANGARWSPLPRLRRAIAAHPVATRWILAGPVAIVAGLATMAAMAVWVPPGTAEINNIAFPIILTPLLWAVPFFYACLAENLERAALVLTGATLAQVMIVLFALA